MVMSERSGDFRTFHLDVANDGTTIIMIVDLIIHVETF